MKEQKKFTKLVVVMILLLISIISVSAYSNPNNYENITLQLNKASYDINEPIFVGISDASLNGIDLSRELQLTIDKKGTYFEYYGNLIFPLNFSSFNKGTYQLLLIRKIDDKLLDVKDIEIDEFNHTQPKSNVSEISCEKLKINMNYIQLIVNNRITFSIENYSSLLNIDVFIEDSFTNYKYVGDYTNILFTPSKPGNYSIKMMCEGIEKEYLSFEVQGDNSSTSYSTSTSFLTFSAMKMPNGVGTGSKINYILEQNASNETLLLKDAYIIDFFDSDYKIESSTHPYELENVGDYTKIKIILRDIKSTDNLVAAITIKKTTGVISEPANPPSISFTFNNKKLNLMGKTYSEVEPKIQILDSDGKTSSAKISLNNVRDINKDNYTLIEVIGDFIDRLFNPGKQNAVIADADIDLSEVKGFANTRIRLNSLDVSNEASLNLNIESLDKSKYKINKFETLKTFSMDLSNINFLNGEFTTKAQGTELWKCQEWNYSTQTCFGTWNKLMNINPGQEYTISISPNDPGYAETGLTSINTNKSVYHPGEIVELIMVVLDQNGSLVPNALVNLKITDPQNNTYYFSTDSETILQKVYGIYYALFNNTLTEGNYSLFVNSSSATTNTAMYSYFTVLNYYPFDILRDVPVTTDPWSGPFTSNIQIISYTNSTTFNLTEVLPNNLTIIDNGNATINSINGTNTLTWYDLINGSTVSYILQPPLVSPDLYELGKAFIEYLDGIFYEYKTWYLAIDPILYSQTCEAQINIVGQDTYSSACDGTYPASCGGGAADRLTCNDGQYETHTGANNNRWAGVRISSYNSSITNCIGITRVDLCYEWWQNSGFDNARIAVDNDNWASPATVSSTIPGTSANPGVTCTDVTSLDNWVCGNFDNTGTAAQAVAQAQRNNAGGTTTLTIDVLYFNLTYAADNPPTVLLQTPSAGYWNDSPTPLLVNFNCSITDDVDAVNISLWLTNKQNTSFAFNDSCTIPTVNGSCSWTKSLAQGNYTWNCLGYDSFGYSDWDTNRTIRLNVSNLRPTTPSSLSCNGGSCFGNFSTSLSLMCSGSTDPDGDPITYTVYKGFQNITYSEVQSWDSTTETGDATWTNSGNSNVCYRDLIRGAYISDNGSDSRINFQAGTDTNLFLDNVYICERGGTDWNCAGTYQQLTFGGSQSTTISASGNGWTDWVNFSIDEQKDYYITFGIGGAGADGVGYKNNGATGAQVLRSGAGITDCDDADWSGKGFTVNTNLFYGVEYIGVNKSTNNGAVYELLGNHSAGSPYVWNLTSETIGKIYDTMQCSAIDITGSNTYSSFYNPSTFIEIDSPPPPNITYIGCFEIGVGWTTCGNIQYGDTLDSVRATCNPGGTGPVQNVTFKLTNIDDNYTYFEQLVTVNSSGYWEYNASDVIITDSGLFNLHVTCRENPTTESDSNWTVAYGSLVANLITPFTDVNVTRNQFFNVTSQVTCVGGECGYVTATLDPAGVQVYNTSGIYTWTVPEGVFSITVKAWGAGGGGGAGGSDPTNGQGGSGGGAGFVMSTLNVTPGENLSILVGGAGQGGVVRGTTTAAGDGGGGGGKTQLNRSNNNLITAAGGGGGGGGDNSAAGTFGGQGGPGGAAVGISGQSSGTSGGGGGATLLAVGSAGTGGATAGTAGSASNGGAGGDNNAGTQGNGAAGGYGGGGNGGLASTAAYGGGGGGGSGYFGAGGGSSSAAGDGGAGAGGGGSSFTNGTQNSTTAGSNSNAANNTDSDYLSYSTNAGRGGTGGNSCTDGTCVGTAGNPGLLLIKYTSGKGVIPMFSGSPFYTLNQNPTSYLNDSCYANMGAGDSCNTTWRVNSTGNANTTWEFFTYYNSINYSTNISQGNSTIINITILDNILPTVPSVYIIPGIPHYTWDLNCSFTVYDANTYDSLTANVSWYRNGVLVHSKILSVSNYVEATSTLNAANTSSDEIWTCGITPSDEFSAGLQYNSTNVTILATLPPVVGIPECQENSTTWESCSSIVYGDFITAVRVNCTDPDVPGAIINATFTLYNNEDSKTFFSNTTTDNSSGYFVFDNNDLHVLDSGTLNLSVSCTDLNETTVPNSFNWYLPFGTLQASLLSPNADVNVTANQFFNFTSQVTCVGGECGYVNATLDPYTPPLNYTTRTCANVWGFDCGTGPPETGGDNTFDSCANGLGADESVESMSVNSTVIAYGQSLNVTCIYDPYTSADYSYIWYYNGTGWRKLFEHLNWGSTSTAVQESVVFTPDNVSGVHWVRCGIIYDAPGDTDQCMDTGSWYDNDDVNFSVSTFYLDGGSKGVVPMGSGNPFYTLDQNTMSYLNNSCLANLTGGGSCNTTWRVNATGSLGSTWEFFTIFDPITYLSFITQVNSSIINVTIISDVVPNVTNITLNPKFPIPVDDLNCTFTIYDPAILEPLRANVSWYLNGGFFGSIIENVISGVEFISTLDSSSTSLNDVWWCGVTPLDNYNVGTQVNSSNVTILNSRPPVIGQVQCLVNNSVWKDCSTLSFKENFSGVRASCSSEALSISNVTFNFTNVPDSNTYINNVTYSPSSGWYSFYKNVTMNNSGEFNLAINCSDNESASDLEFINWSLPWGSLLATLIDPAANTNVEQNKFFLFTSQVECIVGECGNIEAILDPGFPLQNPTNGTPDAGRINDLDGGSDESGGSYVDTQVLDYTFYAIGETLTTDNADSQIELDYNLTASGIYASDVTAITLFLTYCHSGENNFASVDCNGDDPIEKTFSGTQDVWIYNYNTLSWVDIGDLNTANGENLVNSSYSATGTISNYISSQNIITIRTEIVANAGGGDGWLAIDYAPLQINHSTFKYGAISTVVGARPFYTTDANPQNYSHESCLGNLLWGAPACQVSWQVNATGQVNTTHEFWVIYNMTSNQAYVSNNDTKHINITISDGTVVPPVVTLNYPLNALVTNNTSINFNCSVTDNSGLVNMSLYSDFTGAFTVNETKTITGNSNESIFSKNLNDGLYRWNCLAYDTDGNFDWGNSNRTLTVDTTKPGINLSYPANNDIISASQVEFNFTVTDNLDSTLLCNLTIDSIIVDQNFIANNASVTSRIIENISQGDHLWNVTCLDDAGNYNNSLTRNFSVADVPPTVTLLTANNTAVKISSIDLAFLTTDNNGVILATLILNGLDNDTISNPSIVETNTFTLNNLPEGKYNWTVNVSDISNLTAQATIRWFVMDYAPPSINLSQPLNLSLSTNSSIRFNFSVIDNLDSSLICNITINGTLVDTNFSATNASNISRLINNVNDGINFWNVTCIDDAGNYNTSETRIINVSQPPIVSLNSPLDNHSQNFGDLTFNFTPSDNTGISACTLFINDVANQTNSSTITEDVQNSFSLSGLGSGFYNWTVQCNDTFGFSTTASPVRKFTIDASNPQITLFNPSPAENILGQNINFNFTAIDDLDQSMLCNITLDGTLNQTNIISINNSFTNITILVGNDGIHYWNVTCVDDAGNYNVSETRNFTTQNPPDVLLTNPNSGVIFNSTLNIMLNYTAYDSGGLANATLILNGARNKTNSTTLINNGNNNFYLNLSDGFYLWTVNVSDYEGLEGTDTLRNFTVDTTPPVLSIATPINSQTVTWNNVTFNFNATDNLDLVSICNVTVDGFVERDSVNVTNTTPHIFGLELIDGAHNWSINCFDDANNTVNSGLINFTVDAPPNVILNYPINYLRSTNLNYSFNYTPEDYIGFENCTMIYDGAVNETELNVLGNEPNYFNLTNLPEGTHNWTVQCIDQLPDANLYAPPEEYFVIDLSGPNITLLNPAEADILNENNINFNWTTIDYNSSVMVNCNLTIDGVLNQTEIVGYSGNYLNVTVSNLTDGSHNWSVSCIDDLGNPSTSVVGNFTINQPDLFLNSSKISFNNTNPNEGEIINISVNVSNIGGIAANNANVSFWDGDPLTTGIYLGSSVATVSYNSSVIFSVAWAITPGYHTIYVSADPNNLIGELNETNNNATANINYIKVNISYPANNTISADNTPEIHFNVTDFTGGQLNYSVFVDGVANGQSGNVSDSANNSINLNSLADGIHLVIIQGRDVLGRLKNSTPLTLFIDTSAPQTNFITQNASWFNNENITISYNITDTFSTNINYDVYLDGIFNHSNTTISGTTINTTFENLVEGVHTLIIESTDELGNYGNSTTLFFFVDYTNPIPNITTQNGSWFNNANPTINFNITDNLDSVINYTIYVDNVLNVQGTTLNSTLDSDILSGLSNGTHTIILEGIDEAGNLANSTPIIIYVDTVLPFVNLTQPLNNSVHLVNNLDLNFTVYDNMADYLMCNLTLDGSVVAQNLNVSNGTEQNVTLSSLSGGYHYWNVTCVDLATNVNTSVTWRFYILQPDIYVNSSLILFSNYEPKENETVQINATISNIGNSDAGNFTVQLWQGHPDFGGIQINGNVSINLSVGESKNVSVNYLTSIGRKEIFVVADAPISSNGVIIEENESNNIGSRNITVGLWHFASGSTGDRLVVTDAISRLLFDWNVLNSSGSNIFVADSDSSITWQELQALGRDTSNNPVFDDFEEFDTAIGAENFTDSVNLTYTIGGAPVELNSYSVFDILINNVPVTNSTNNTNFKTGILWDYSDGGVQYDASQDVVLISQLEENLQGYNSTVDFEIRIPATLREYLGPETSSVDFYIEVK